MGYLIVSLMRFIVHRTFTIFIIVLLILASIPPVSVSAQNQGAIVAGDPGVTPPSNTLNPFTSFRIKGDVVTGGVGLRTLGFGSITITGILPGSTVLKAYLYWATLGNATAPSFLPFPAGADQGILNGTTITGALIGGDISPCWSPSSIHVFRADVTSLVSGNGIYNLTGFADSKNTDIAPSIEGASLVVVFSHPSLPFKEIQIYDGAETVKGSTNTTVVEGFKASSPVDDAKLTMIVADGQIFGNFDDNLIVNGVSLGGNNFNGDDGFMWDNDAFDVTTLIPANSTSAEITLASTFDPATKSADCLTWVALVFSVSTQPSAPTIGPDLLALFFSNDPGPDHPLSINYRYITRTQGLIIADVIVTNLVGAWYQATVDFSNPSSGAPFPVALTEGQIPFAFLLGPFQQKIFERVVFREGEYLHFNLTRISLAALSVFAIDLIGRGIFGVDLGEFSKRGFIDLSLGALPSLFSTIGSNCGGPALALGTCVGLLRIPCAIDNCAKFMKCTVTNREVRQAIGRLITGLYDNETARQWIELSADTISNIILLFGHIPRMAVLTDQTFIAATDGFVRLEARRL